VSAASANRRALRRLIFFLLALALWTLLAMYPNPAVFFRNLARYHRLPLDPQIEQKMGWELPPEPATIEFFVDSLILSTPDWPLYRVPWYVPTAREAALYVHGDCESKTILFASILEGKHLPYEVRASFTHIWVDYPGRAEREGESKDIAYLEGEPGKFRLHWPDRVSWRTFLSMQREQLWDAMPLARKAIWLLGLTWVALASVVLGGPRLTGDLVSQWRVRAPAYSSRAAWLAFVVFMVIALSPSFRSNAPPVRWALVDLYEVLALSLLAGAFLTWIAVVRPRRAVSFDEDATHLQRHWSFGAFRGSARLKAENLKHFQLASSADGVTPWVISAALISGEHLVLLRYGREVAARAALRALGKALDRPIVVRASGCEYWAAADEIGLSLRERAAQRPRSEPSPRPSDLYLTVDEVDGRWAVGYVRREPGVAKALLLIAAMVAAATILGTVILAFFPHSLAAWFLWTTAAVLLGMTVYAAMSLREEILASLAGSHVEIGEGELSFHRADGKSESVSLGAIESVELAHKGHLPTIAVVAPERVLHVKLYCAPKHREWVREAIAGAIAAAEAPE